MAVVVVMIMVVVMMMVLVVVMVVVISVVVTFLNIRTMLTEEVDNENIDTLQCEGQ